MANIVIKEILASDTVSDLVDKVNFNFDQLLLNGGGPAGPLGGSGPAGPLGPRGSIWFTANDIYNTSTTTTPDPPLVFPLWSGTAQKVNNIALPGYPQFSGDPNRYLPAAAVVTGTYPENSFIIGTTGKVPRSGDLYLQETDDTFDSFSSTDGDVWEFNGVSETWTYTGVNIKGDTGGTGATGFTEWVRTNDASPALNDFLRPEIITANDPVVRVVLGANSGTQAEDILDEAGEYSDNILTLFGSAPSPSNPEAWRTQLSFTDEYSIQAPSVSTYDYSRIFSNNNILHVQGFNDSGANVNNYDLRLTARSGMVQLQSNKVNSPAVTQTLLLNTDTRQFIVTNGVLEVSVPFSTPSQASPAGNLVQHRFTDTQATFYIRHMGQSGMGIAAFNGSYTYNSTAGPMMQLFSYNQVTTTNRSTLNLNYWSKDRVAIGYFGQSGNNEVNGKLAINTGQPTVYASSIDFKNIAGIIVGDNWSRSSSITFNKRGSSESGIIDNSIFAQAQINIGVTGSANQLVTMGDSSENSLNARSSVNIKEGVLAFNAYKPTGVNTFNSMGSSTAGGNYIIGPGKWLRTTTGSPAYQTEMDGALVIAGNNGDGTSIDSTFGSLAAVLSVWTQWAGSPNNAQVLLNTAQREISSVQLPNNLIRGSAIIGKLNFYSGSGTFGHQDDIANGNIIIGNSSGTATASPRINATSDGNTLSTSRTNHTYIGTPVFNGSLSFTGGDNNNTATNTSRSSDATIGSTVYNDYFRTPYAQFKLVHGRSYIIPNSLDSTSNPYNTGIGIEIETRVANGQTSDTPATLELYRTPVTMNASGVLVEGTRPLLISKVRQDLTAGVPAILFEVSPTNNISVGRAIKYPAKAVATGLAVSKNSALGNTNKFMLPDATGVVALTPSNSGRWYDITNGDTVITPQLNRSLHISNIIFPADTFTNAGLYKLDQNVADIQAGIVFKLAGYRGTGAITDLSNLMNKIYDTNTPETQTITTAVTAFNNYSSSVELYAALALGVKPGYLVYDSNGGPGAFEPQVIKGSDVYIEGGDTILVAGDGANPRGVRPGDVFISGGQTYQDTYGNNGLTDITGLGVNVRQFSAGNVYLGSRITNIDGSGYTDNGIIKSSLVYVGYDALDAYSFESDNIAYNPKGTASLNVSTQEPGSGNNEILAFSGLQRSVNRAINIQKGDIVTANQVTGWIEYNYQGLVNSTNRLTNITARADVDAFGSGHAVTSPGTVTCLMPLSSEISNWGPGVTTRTAGYKAYYKVIGHTVWFQLHILDLRVPIIVDNAWTVSTTIPNVYKYADLIKIDNQIWAAAGTEDGLPKPLVGINAIFSPLDIFTTQTAFTFNATGTLWLLNTEKYRQLADNDKISQFITGGPNDVGYSEPLTSTPITVTYNSEGDGELIIRKAGASSLLVSNKFIDPANTKMNAMYPSPLTEQQRLQAVHACLASGRQLLSMNGLPFHPAYDSGDVSGWPTPGTLDGERFNATNTFSSPAYDNPNTRYAIIISGQYQLDPDEWVW